MSAFHLLSDLGSVDERLLAPLRAMAGGEVDARRRDWMDAYAEVDDIPDRPEAALYLEWVDGPGLFDLQIDIFGPQFRDGLSEAAFARELAQAVGRPFIFGDCDFNPSTWLMAEPDGTIRHVWQKADTPDDRLDLEPDIVAWPVVVGAEDALPPPVAQGGLPRATCESRSDWCVIFHAIGCPRAGRYAAVRWIDD